MWITSLLTSGATSFGRLVIVKLLPNSVPIISLWLLLRAGSFSGQSDWRQLVPADLKSDVLAIILAVLAIALLAALVQPFQLRIVRLLEGYWESWALTARIAPVLTEYQRRKIITLRHRDNTLYRQLKGEPDKTLSLSDLAREQRKRLRQTAERIRVRRKIARYPRQVERVVPLEGGGKDKDIPLMPTALGNALRAAEHAGGERYGLDTLTSWPRIYPLFSERFAAAQGASRDSMDAASTLCVGFLVATGLGAGALWDEPKAYWILVVTVFLSWWSYVGAVAAAVQYGMHIRVAYDLHRHDLLTAMHLPLPETLEEEYMRFRHLTKFLQADDRGLPAKGLAMVKLSPEEYDHTRSEQNSQQNTNPAP